MYIGRFAPSPTGPLHFGSLVAALASFLDAKAHGGLWLVRIEDLDTPRCQVGSDKLIIKTLEAHGMTPDGPIVYQSTRLAAYETCVTEFLVEKRAYFCQCTRKQIKAQGGVHSRECRNQGYTEGAIRFFNESPIKEFPDRYCGQTHVDDPHALEDFVLQRRDAIFAYNLAVVLDDIHQGVTHIVRGDDLLTTTSAQLSLYKQLKETPPSYFHIPVINDEHGNKLSKQNHAPAVSNDKHTENIVNALEALGIPITPDKFDLDVENLLRFAVQSWQKRWA